MLQVPSLDREIDYGWKGLFFLSSKPNESPDLRGLAFDFNNTSNGSLGLPEEPQPPWL